MQSLFERRFESILLAIWLITSGLLLLMGQEAIRNWRFGDPDDQLRIVQVRDWLAGQSWWDITQYRMNPPEGGPMHWSRLVDIPLAAAILFFSLFMNRESSELVASVLIPLFTYGAALWVYARIGKRLFGAGAALLAATVLVTLLPVMAQLVPMRIDHHGWQFVLFMAATSALFWKEKPLIAAAIAGFSLAFWLEISIEGMPFAALFMGLFALRWFFPKLQRSVADEDAFPIGLLFLAGSVAVLFTLSESWVSHGNHCDSLSSFHVAILSIVALTIASGHILSRRFRVGNILVIKLLLCTVAGAAGISVLMLIAPQCSGDAFASLDPLVREYWYDRVPEGLPVWALHSNFAAPYWGGFASVLLGLAYAFWAKKPTEFKDRIILALLLMGASVIGLLVSRTALYPIALANLLTASLFIALMRRAEQLKAIGPRMALRTFAVAIIIASTISQNLESAIANQELKADPKRDLQEQWFEKQTRLCQKPAAVRALNALPKAAQLMVGLDSAPAVLVFTDKKVVATGHHRNQNAMADVIRAFIGSEQQAKAIYKKRGIEYLVTCEGSFELQIYYQRAPNGFGAQVHEGKLPRWLAKDQPIGPFNVYRVNWSQEDKK
jgi:hypothetical protein